MDETYVTHEVPKQNDPVFTPITNDEIASTHYHDLFSSGILRSLNEGDGLPFKVDE